LREAYLRKLSLMSARMAIGNVFEYIKNEPVKTDFRH